MKIMRNAQIIRKANAKAHKTPKIHPFQGALQQAYAACQAWILSTTLTCFLMFTGELHV
jgi:hypothetical protein